MMSEDMIEKQIIMETIIKVKVEAIEIHQIEVMLRKNSESIEKIVIISSLKRLKNIKLFIKFNFL
jgi:hypothetical protein